MEQIKLKSFTNKIMHWTKHYATTIYIKDICNIILQSFKCFQLQTFIFFLDGAPTYMCHFFSPSICLLRIISQEPYII